MQKSLEGDLGFYHCRHNGCNQGQYRFNTEKFRNVGSAFWRPDGTTLVASRNYRAPGLVTDLARQKTHVAHQVCTFYQARAFFTMVCFTLSCCGRQASHTKGGHRCTPDERNEPRRSAHKLGHDAIVSNMYNILLTPSYTHRLCARTVRELCHVEYCLSLDLQ